MAVSNSAQKESQLGHWVAWKEEEQREVFFLVRQSANHDHLSLNFSNRTESHPSVTSNAISVV